MCSSLSYIFKNTRRQNQLQSKAIYCLKKQCPGLVFKLLTCPANNNREHFATLEWELASFEAFIPGVVRGGTDWAALNNGALENLKQNKGNINAREEVFFCTTLHRCYCYSSSNF